MPFVSLITGIPEASAAKVTSVDHVDFCLLRWSENYRSTGRRQAMENPHQKNGGLIHL